MKGIVKNIKQQALDNDYFRQVLETGEKTQVVIMSIPPGEDIGEETHDKEDQVLWLIDGNGEVTLDGVSSPYEAGDVVLVRHGVKHNFINKGDKPMKIITTYSPPHHPSGTVHKTKADAQAAEY